MNHKNLKSQKELFDQLSCQWQLINIRLLSFNANQVFLAYSKKYNSDVVLKILSSDTHEVEALKIFKGNGCVNLLDYAPKLKVLLLEYITPGISLKTLFPENDFKAVEITAEIIKKLQSKNPISKTNNFKTIYQWLDLLNTFQSKKIPKKLLEKAKKLSNKLLNEKQKLYLLHGDLHHENILQKNIDWIAIDPKGIIGPLEYEVGRFIMNPIPSLLEQKNAKEIILHRINQFSKIFDFKKQDLIDWTFVQAILSACWAEQDNNNEILNFFLKFAQILEKLS